MKWFLILWAAPLGLLGGWYGLSYYDVSLGIFMLSREAHDLVFRIYGDLLGIAPESIPPLVLRAIIFDTAIVLGILAFRRRRSIAAWWRGRQVLAASSSRRSEESLSSAP